MGAEQIRVPCVFMRGGTSRGAYLWAGDLPDDPEALFRGDGAFRGLSSTPSEKADLSLIHI